MTLNLLWWFCWGCYATSAKIIAFIRQNQNIIPPVTHRLLKIITQTVESIWSERERFISLNTRDGSRNGSFYIYIILKNHWQMNKWFNLSAQSALLFLLKMLNAAKNCFISDVVYLWPHGVPNKSNFCLYPHEWAKMSCGTEEIEGIRSESVGIGSDSLQSIVS